LINHVIIYYYNKLQVWSCSSNSRNGEDGESGDEWSMCVPFTCNGHEWLRK